MLITLLLEQGQVMPYVDASIMMILEIGIGVIYLMVIGTTNHLSIMKHPTTSLLASLALIE